jgi:hypothetical protein
LLHFVLALSSAGGNSCRGRPAVRPLNESADVGDELALSLDVTQKGVGTLGTEDTLKGQGLKVFQDA